MTAPPLRSCLRLSVRTLLGRRRALARLTAGVAAVVALAAPARAGAQVPLAPGAWAFFEWLLGAGPVEGPGFVLDAAERTRLRVTDAGTTGDAFDVLVNGLLFSTPSVPGGTESGLFDPELAWAEPALSKGELFLDPGQYVITLAVREAASGADFGEGYLRADPAPLAPGVVPEPAPLALLAGGAGVLLLARRARRR